MSRLPLKKETQNGYLLAFCLCALTALFIFLPFMVVDRGLFQYCGDFNSQQIPFYSYMNDFVKHGGGQWSWETDLGSSAVNSYSFYLLGSPFFWLSTVFPARWLPFLMAPLLALKFGVAGLGAYGWLRRYTRTQSFTIVGACLYALSGFTVYNVFFNHFVDCVALFPFLLWALDEFMYEDRRGIFALAVAVNLLNNYFFFAGQIIFLIIYFFVKLACRDYRIRPAKFGLLALESVLGVAMGGVLLWPAMLSLKDNPRTVDLSSGWGFLMYGKVQQYFAIFTSLFLPPDPPYMPSIYSEGVIKWTSLSAFLPVVSCAGVLAYVRARKKSPVTRILWICLFMAFVPVLNSSFYALNSSYYARWYYMPVLLMCAATVHALEEPEIDLGGALKTVAVITVAFAVFALVPVNTEGKWSFGVAENPSQFWLMYLTALLGLLLFYFVWRYWRGTPRFAVALLSAVLAFSVLYSVLHISLGKFAQWDADINYRSQCYVAAPAVSWPEDENDYRIDSYKCYDNIGLWTGKSCIQFFNSTVTPSIMDFYPRLGVKRDVNSKPDAEKYALRGLLGVKYTLVPQASASEFKANYGEQGWSYAFETDKFMVFQNANYIGMGFAANNYVLMGELEGMSEETRAAMLVRAVGLTPEQVQKYGAYLTKVTPESTAPFTYETYAEDISALRENAVQSFEMKGSGFTAKGSLPYTKFMFFSVPYDSGFTATVNGEPVDIEYVSGGMCGLLCPGGDVTVEFTYHTPGLRPAALAAVGGVCAWALYCGAIFYSRRKQKHVGEQAEETKEKQEKNA